MKQTAKIREIGILIERLSRLIRSHEHDTALNPVQWEVLRYLARCNRFSNSPKALTSYLMSTKGTISQTLMVLERKGLIKKKKRIGQGRSVELILTDEGRRQLEKDPWYKLDAQVALLSQTNLDTLNRQLQNILHTALESNRYRSFGLCRFCRHFRRNKNIGNRDLPHQCSLLDVPLADEDSDSICAEHENANHL
jgi:DNA-binding MarR family transcriptional regulator